MSTSSLIQTAHQLTNSDAKDMLLYKEEVNKLLAFNKESKGTDLLIPLKFYLGILDDTNAVFFPFMTEDKKNRLIRDLQVTYLFLLAEKKYELEHQKTEHVKEYDLQLKKCQDLLDLLLYKKHCNEHQLQPAPEHGHASEGKPIAYLGIFAGLSFADQMVAMADRKTKTIRENMDWLNEKRLYWVWGSSFLKAMLSLLPSDFFYAEQAQQVARIPDPYTGAMSWALYYFRFALNLGLLLKHTIRGPWMSETEKGEAWSERFQTQWSQRKFTLLNDLIWATGNLLCFFWLIGKGAAGTWGDMLTVVLLVFDITLTVWDYEEQRVQHNKQMHDYNDAIKKLEAQIEDLNATRDNEDKEAQKQLLDLNLQISALERARTQCAREWNYQKMNLTNNIAYAIGLMLAFVLLAAPFFPVAATTVAAITMSGAVLCFALSVIYNAIKSGIELNKAKMTVKELKEAQSQKVNAFKELVTLGADENAKRLMFLEVKKLMVDTEYQEKMITLQTMKLIRNIIIESLIPAVAFVSLVFLPLGPGIGVIAAALALAVATHFLINALFKLEKEEIKEFNEQEYQAFCDDPEHWNNQTTKSPTFFQPEKELSSMQPSKGPKPSDEMERQPLLGSSSCS